MPDATTEYACGHKLHVGSVNGLERLTPCPECLRAYNSSAIGPLRCDVRLSQEVPLQFSFVVRGKIATEMRSLINRGFIWKDNKFQLQTPLDLGTVRSLNDLRWVLLFKKDEFEARLEDQWRWEYTKAYWDYKRVETPQEKPKPPVWYSEDVHWDGIIRDINGQSVVYFSGAPRFLTDEEVVVLKKYQEDTLEYHKMRQLNQKFCWQDLVASVPSPWLEDYSNKRRNYFYACCEAVLDLLWPTVEEEPEEETVEEEEEPVVEQRKQERVSEFPAPVVISAPSYREVTPKRVTIFQRCSSLSVLVPLLRGVCILLFWIAAFALFLAIIPIFSIVCCIAGKDPGWLSSYLDCLFGKRKR